MAHTAAFTAAVRAIQTKNPHMDVYTLIATADEVCRALGQPVVEDVTADQKHESLVWRAEGDEEVIGFLRNGQKINAIKRLRAISDSSLKEAKDAVEDRRMDRYYNRPTF